MFVGLPPISVGFSFLLNHTRSAVCAFPVTTCHALSYGYAHHIWRVTHFPLETYSFIFSSRVLPEYAYRQFCMKQAYSRKNTHSSIKAAWMFNVLVINWTFCSQWRNPSSATIAAAATSSAAPWRSTERGAMCTFRAKAPLREVSARHQRSHSLRRQQLWNYSKTHLTHAHVTADVIWPRHSLHRPIATNGHSYSLLLLADSVMIASCALMSLWQLPHHYS